MEKLEMQIKAEEAEFIHRVEVILTFNHGSNRLKAQLMYKHYIKMQVAIDDLVSAAKLETPPAGEASSALA